MDLVIKIDENVFTRLFDNGTEDYAIANDDLFAIAKAIRKGTPLSKTIDSLKELSKDHRHNFVGNSCEERAWRLGIEDSIDLILAESEVNADGDSD